MPRHPTPHYRADRECYVAQVGGVQRILSRVRDYKSRAAAERAAVRELARIWAEHQASGAPAGRCPPFGEIAVAFLSDCRSRVDRGDLTAKRAEEYGWHLRRWMAAFGDTAADKVGLPDVEAALNGRTTWGRNTRADAGRALVVCYRWARRRKLIACDPPGLPALPRKAKRDRLPTWEEVQAVIAASHRAVFTDLASVVGWTGCRPSEAARLEARHIDWDRGVAILVEHKTSRKTDRPRVIPLPSPVLAILRRLAEAHPEGPLLRREDGGRWDKESWGRAMRVIVKRAGVDKRITLYTFRHGRATALLLAGVPISDVASVLGNSVAMVDRTYSDVVSQFEHLRRVAETSVTSPSVPAPPPRPSPALLADGPGGGEGGAK